MAKQKIEELSDKVLLKRKKFILFLTGLFVGVLLVWMGLIIYDFVKEGESTSSTITGAISTLACFWIPLIMLGKVNAEIKRRKEDQ